MLFKDETTKPTPRLPKTNQEQFTTEILVQNDEPFEYVESETEEEEKYLENAIAIPENEEVEELIQNLSEGATDFDELLAKTQASSNGKNARSLQLDNSSGYGSAKSTNQLSTMPLFVASIMAFYLF